MTLEDTGIYTIPCEVNGLKLRFVFDTGASEVHLSLIEAAFMLKNGYITKDDIIGRGEYSMADGSIVENSIVNLKEIKIGNIVINNVKACISSNIEASLLLGQSAISKLGTYSISGNYLILNRHSIGGKSEGNNISNNTVNNIKEYYNGNNCKVYKDGVYKGDFLNGKRHGNGSMLYNDGDEYVGHWANDEFDGKGIYTWKNGDKYAGNYKAGYRHGFGVYTFVNGDTYKGNYINNRRSGYGKISYSSGGSYEGEWLGGVMDGKGTRIYDNGNKYVGEFEGGKRSGQGIIIYYSTGNKYNGAWKNDQFEGFGTYTWKKGDTYTGNFKKGEKEGYGTYTWPNGDKFVGYWMHDKRNGDGIDYYSDGEILKGTWIDGVFQNNNSSIKADNNSLMTDKIKSSKNFTTPSNNYNKNSYIGRKEYTPKSYYTAYTISAIKLRKGPGNEFDIINSIPEGELVFMEATERFKNFSKVLFIKTGEEGYVSSKFLDGYTEVEVDEKGTLEIVGKTYNKYAEVNLKNDANVTAKISIGDNVYTISPYSSKKVKNIASGTYNIKASSPGIIPYVGVDTIEGGYEYSWRFYIKKRKK